MSSLRPLVQDKGPGEGIGGGTAPSATTAQHERSALLHNGDAQPNLRVELNPVCALSAGDTADWSLAWPAARHGMVGRDAWIQRKRVEANLGVDCRQELVTRRVPGRRRAMTNELAEHSPSSLTKPTASVSRQRRTAGQRRLDPSALAPDALQGRTPGRPSCSQGQMGYDRFS